ADHPTLVRVHIPSQLRDFLTLVEPGKEKYPRWTFHKAMERLATEDSGVIIMINAETGLDGRSVEESLEDVFGERVKQSQPGSEQIQFQQRSEEHTSELQSRENLV